MAQVTRALLLQVVQAGYDAFLNTLTAAGDPAALDLIVEQWQVQVEGQLVDMYGGLYKAGALSAWIQMPGDPLAPPAEFDDWARIVNYDAVDYQRQATNRLVGVGDNVWSTVRDKTVTGIEQGLSNEELKELIRADGELTRFSEYRADTIARTETNAAYNGGNYAGAQAMGDMGPVAKVWSSVVDRRTRASHLAANEQTVAFDQPFSIGGISMMRPHDPAAPAKEVVNCRCRTLFLFDGMADSTGKVWRREKLTPTPSPAPAPKPAAKRPTKPKAPAKPKAAAKPVRPPVPEAGFDTWDEARAYLETHHPQVTWDDDMAKWDRRMVRDTAKWANEMSDQYPQYWSRMTYMGSGTGSKVPPNLRYNWSRQNHYGHAYLDYARTTGEGVIQMSPKYALDYDSFVAAKARGKASGWSFGGDPYSTLVHEFGHIVDGLVRRDIAFKTPGGGGFLKVAFGPFAEAGDVVATVANAMDKFLAYSKKRMLGWGSEYATKNFAETFAESFVARHYGIGAPDGPGGLASAWLELASTAYNPTLVAQSAATAADLLIAYDNLERIMALVGMTTFPGQVTTFPGLYARRKALTMLLSS